MHPDRSPHKAVIRDGKTRRHGADRLMALAFGGRIPERVARSEFDREGGDPAIDRALGVELWKARSSTDRVKKSAIVAEIKPVLAHIQEPRAEIGEIIPQLGFRRLGHLTLERDQKLVRKGDIGDERSMAARQGDMREFIFPARPPGPNLFNYKVGEFNLNHCLHCRRQHRFERRIDPPRQVRYRVLIDRVHAIKIDDEIRRWRRRWRRFRNWRRRQEAEPLAKLKADDLKRFDYW